MRTRYVGHYRYIGLAQEVKALDDLTK